MVVAFVMIVAVVGFGYAAVGIVGAVAFGGCCGGSGFLLCVGCLVLVD